MAVKAGGGGAARPTDAAELAQLLAELRAIEDDIADGISSIVMRHRLRGKARQLAARAAAIGATPELGDHARAIEAAIARCRRDQAVAACEAFGLAVG